MSHGNEQKLQVDSKEGELILIFYFTGKFLGTGHTYIHNLWAKL